jgi:hypothetical protein
LAHFSQNTFVQVRLPDALRLQNYRLETQWCRVKRKELCGSSDENQKVGNGTGMFRAVGQATYPKGPSTAGDKAARESNGGLVRV